MEKKVVLVGNAVTAEVLCSYLQIDGRYQVSGLVVDDQYVDTGTISDVRTLGLSHLAEEYPRDEYSLIMAMGYNDLNQARERLFNKLIELGYEFETYVHPTAFVASDATVGKGSVVLPGAVIEPRSKVGSNTMVWSNVTLAHHSTVGANCWVAAGTVVSGKAVIERNSFLGVGSIIVNEVTVGEFNIIGAGALVSRDTKPHSVHLSRSAEPFRFSSEDYVKHFGI
ncbi:acetyltransferase [uncultured Roseibium sp.]|uniref:acetyltransferase n=1 Tax=uncultured Roseibium sp. TaxID=1936171 RepID=UPI0026367FA8|nr:acetyltransferase [uncultured Roseibium sp.]